MPRPKSDWQKCNYYLPPATVRAIKRLAAFRNVTTSELVRDALQKYAVAELTKERERVDLDELSAPLAAKPVAAPPLPPSPPQEPDTDDGYIDPTPVVVPPFRPRARG